MIRFNDVRFSYAASDRSALDEIDLEIKDGEFILIAGDSGSGKSTLLRCLNGLVPHFYGGKFGGRVTVNGIDTKTAAVAELSTSVGLVFQDSGAQIVTETVEEEIAFGPRNLGLSARDVTGRVERAVREMNLGGLAGRRTATLSGGEKQKLVIASVLSLEPAIVALDEPLAELDPDSAADLVKLLQDLNKRLGLTVIVAEHRLDLLLPVVDRVVGMVGGKCAERSNVGANLQVGAAESQSKDRLLHQTKDTKTDAATRDSGGVVLEVKDLAVAYDERPVLDGAEFSVRGGEIVALMGNNGAGKTTLFRTIAGFIKPSAGAVMINGRDTAAMTGAEILRAAGYVPQRPSALLFAETVAEELATEGTGKTRTTGKMKHTESPPDPSGPTGLMYELGLASHAGDYPRDLSLGEQQRVALAAVLSNQPSLLLLDEPTHGLDHGAKVRLAEILRAQAAAGAAVVLATHDHDMAALVADRVLNLENGKVR